MTEKENRRNIVVARGRTRLENQMKRNEFNVRKSLDYIFASASFYIVCTQQPSVNDKEIFNKSQRIKMSFFGKGFISLGFLAWPGFVILYVLRTKELARSHTMTAF